MMNTLIIDVREPVEYASGHVEGAINLPPSQLMGNPPQLENTPKDTPIIVYCRTGSRSNVAMNLLQNMGFSNITNGINKGHVERRLHGTNL